MENLDCISAFGEDAASRLSGVSVGQLRAWRKSEFFKPSMMSASGVPYGQVYSFSDVAALRVLNELRNNSKCTMAHLREVRDTLSGLGNDRWTKTRLYVVNREVVFVPEGDARPEGVITGQGIITIMLADVVEDLQTAIMELNSRDPATVGKISKSRHILRNTPVIAGTRIPVSTIVEWLDAGYSESAIISEYPDLTSDDIAAVIAYGAEKAA